MANAGAKLSSFPEVNDIQTGDMFPLLSGGNTNAKIDYATLADAIIAKLKSEAGDSVLSINGRTGAVTINKSDVGLGNVDNTSDADKPISTATQAAIDKKADKSVATESTDGLMSAADKKAIDREFFRMLPKGGTYIPAKADLNSIEYIKVGNYYNPLAGESGTIKNIPTGNAFIMYVLSPLSEAYDDESTRVGVYRLRIFIECTGNIFIQFVNSENTAGSFNYGPWIKMTNSNDLGAVSNTINTHIANKSNPHAVTKAQVGLGNVDNTSDADKPISTAVQTALDKKVDKTLATVSANGLMSAADKKAIDREFFRMLPKGGTHIPANADLNSIEYLKVGNYYNSANVDAATINNIPNKRAFIMYVLAPLSEFYDNESTDQWVYRLRIFVTYNGLIYTQYAYCGDTKGVFTYEPWTKLATDADASPIKTVKVNGTALTPDSNKAVNIAVPTLANNATTTSAGMALDARMGKTLSDQANQLAKNTAQIETAGTATSAHSAGEYVMISNALYKVTAAVAKGDAWTIGTNVTAANIGSEIGSLKSDLAKSFEPSYTEITTGFTSPVVSGKVCIIKWGKFCVAVIAITIDSQLEDWKKYKICEISQKAYIKSAGICYGINNHRPVILEVDGTTLLLNTQGGTPAPIDAYQGQVAYVSN